MRLLYLDEGGTDAKAPILTVAGVLVDVDRDYSEIDRRLDLLVEQFIPEPDRLGFVFHATDIFHGSGYFDRRRKPQWNGLATRIPIIDGLARIIEDLNFPIVMGVYRKDHFGDDHPIWDEPLDQKSKGNFLHSSAVMDCLMRTDKWIAAERPHELAMVVHEDGTPAKKMIKNIVRTMRNRQRMTAKGFDVGFMERHQLPLKRVVDTVHFVEKANSRPLQLADLCAFILARGLRGPEVQVPAYATQVLLKNMSWFFKDYLPPGITNLSEIGKPSASSQ